MNPRSLPSDFLPLTRQRRERIEATVEALLAILDADDGDENLEPYLAGTHNQDDDREGDGGAYGMDEDFEPSLGWTVSGALGENPRWGNLWGTLEEENEHGGDILDEPHDPDGDDDPTLGWPERDSQGADFRASLRQFGGPSYRVPEIDPRILHRPVSNPTLEPELYPETFSIVGDGTCCEPLIKDGGRVIVDKRRKPKPGDFVVIYRDPKAVSAGDHVLKVKRLVGEGPTAIVTEMLNPPRRIEFLRHQVKAVWYCEPAPEGFRPNRLLTDADILAERAGR